MLDAECLFCVFFRDKNCTSISDSERARQTVSSFHINMFQSSIARISNTSSVDEVCEWAISTVSNGGVGLDEEDVCILRKEKIKGSTLFKLTDTMLKEAGMKLGPRTDLLDAITHLITGAQAS